jgi:hypothetical protein
VGGKNKTKIVSKTIVLMNIQLTKKAFYCLVGWTSQNLNVESVVLKVKRDINEKIKNKKVDKVQCL